MSTLTQKIIKPKLGLLELAKQLGNVSKGLQSDGLQSRYILSISRALSI